MLLCDDIERGRGRTYCMLEILREMLYVFKVLQRMCTQQPY